MTARRLFFSLMAMGAVAVAWGQAEVPDSTAVWQRRVMSYNRFWGHLVPDGMQLQFAGNMGMFSAGPMWSYGRARHWETALLFGIIPRHDAHHALVTMTLKQNYVPWSVRLGHSQFRLQPLTASVYFNTVFSNKFWTRQPHRYPKGYYWFSTRVRSNIALGQRIRFDIPSDRRQFAGNIRLFYEVGTCDFYLIQAVKNSYLKPHHILSLSLGVQFEWQ